MPTVNEPLINYTDNPRTTATAREAWAAWRHRDAPTSLQVGDICVMEPHLIGVYFPGRDRPHFVRVVAASDNEYGIRVERVDGAVPTPNTRGDNSQYVDLGRLRTLSQGWRLVEPTPTIATEIIEDDVEFDPGERRILTDAERVNPAYLSAAVRWADEVAGEYVRSRSRITLVWRYSAQATTMMWLHNRIGWGIPQMRMFMADMEQRLRDHGHEVNWGDFAIAVRNRRGMLDRFRHAACLATSTAYCEHTHYVRDYAEPSSREPALHYTSDAFDTRNFEFYYLRGNTVQSQGGRCHDCNFRMNEANHNADQDECYCETGYCENCDDYTDINHSNLCAECNVSEEGVCPCCGMIPSEHSPDVSGCDGLDLDIDEEMWACITQLTNLARVNPEQLVIWSTQEIEVGDNQLTLIA